MAFRSRIVPLVILASVGLLALKLGNLSSVVLAAPAGAQAPEPAAAPAPAAASPPTPAAGTPGAANPATPSAAEKPSAIDPLSMSPAEIDLLQQLSDRRAALDKRAAEVSQREVLLQAAETRIDEKIAKLAALEKDIDRNVEKQDQETDARTKSLVKIYETMKPHDAARILEQLDMGVLLAVVQHMKERNAAPILASMDPVKARIVTQALAARQSGAKTDGAGKPPTKP
jgi:flagellar motility protein MotE (MotC chaperone)